MAEEEEEEEDADLEEAGEAGEAGEVGEEEEGEEVGPLSRLDCLPNGKIIFSIVFQILKRNF